MGASGGGALCARSTRSLQTSSSRSGHASPAQSSASGHLAPDAGACGGTTQADRAKLRVSERGSGAGPLRGAALGGLVSPYDLGAVCAGLPRGPTRPLASAADATTSACQDRDRKGGLYQQSIDLRVELLPLPVPEIRHVLWALGQAVSAEAAAQILAWSE
jgi:hypothetical protein